MAKSEDTTSGTTVTQNKNSSKYDMGQKRTLSDQGGREDRGKARNNTIDSLASTGKD